MHSPTAHDARGRRAERTDALAEQARIAPRYAVEWLEQQAVAGLLDVEAPDGPVEARRYRLDPAHARVLADPDDPAHVAPFAHMLAGIGGVIDRVDVLPVDNDFFRVYRLHP
jgi:hypothetical protein